MGGSAALQAVRAGACCAHLRASLQTAAQATSCKQLQTSNSLQPLRTDQLHTIGFPARTQLDEGGTQLQDRLPNPHRQRAPSLRLLLRSHAAWVAPGLVENGPARRAAAGWRTAWRAVPGALYVAGHTRAWVATKWPRLKPAWPSSQGRMHEVAQPSHPPPGPAAAASTQHEHKAHTHTPKQASTPVQTPT